MPFTPTTWNAGGAPGIDAVALNRIEAGIAQLWAARRDIVTDTANRTLVLADAGKIVEVDSASSRTVTVPPNSDEAFPVGTQLDVVRVGAGSVTILAGAGVTVRRSAALSNVLAEQWSAVTLYKRATNEWVLVGDLVLV